MPWDISGQRPTLGVCGLRLTVLGKDRAVGRPFDRDERQPQRVRDGTDHGLQDGTRGGHGVQTLAQVAQRPVGIAAVTVEQLVDQVLAAAKGRPEDQRGDRSRHHQPDPVALECCDAGRQSREDPGDQDGDQQVRRRPADDAVDGPQSVAHDRDGQRGGEEQPVDEVHAERERFGDGTRGEGGPKMEG